MPRWTADARDYARDAAFVPQLTDELRTLLGPVDGRRVLDLGCGDGTFTHTLVTAGADVLAVDADASMVAATAARGIEARVADARTLHGVDGPFDAVVSNAVLHWVPEPDLVVARVAELLRPGGVFVAEAGGHGNVAAIRVALRAALDEHGHTSVEVPQWWFPTEARQRAVLEAAGLVVEHVELCARPTPLAAGMLAWLRTFTTATLGRVSDADAVLRRTEQLLAPVLRDDAGGWTADYVRIRFRAVRPGRRLT